MPTVSHAERPSASVTHTVASYVPRLNDGFDVMMPSMAAANWRIGGQPFPSPQRWNAGLAFAAIPLSFLMPWLAYVLLKPTTRPSAATAAATGAAYGS